MSQNPAEEIRCSFSAYSSDIPCQNTYGGRCQSVGLIKLSECNRSVKDHLRSLKLAVGGDETTGFTSSTHDIYTEADLICRRAGLFTTDQSLSVCPAHRSKLGIDFRQRKKCCIPVHKGKGKAFRGISSNQSEHILRRYGTLVPVGSGICYGCYRCLSQDSCSLVDEISKLTQPTEETTSKEDQNGITTRQNTSCLKSVKYTSQPLEYVSNEEMVSLVF